MNKILAVDTCTETCSAALLHGETMLAECEIAPREHSQKLLPMVESLLVQADLELSDMDAIAFGRGPGSFTGVRIGTAAAQGLALGADKPMVPISTLAAMALQAAKRWGDGLVIAAIDARMGEVYIGAYQVQGGDLTCVIDEQVCKPDAWPTELPEHNQLVLVGTGWSAYPDMQERLTSTIEAVEGAFYPQAEEMAELAIKEVDSGNLADAADVEPVYLRDKVTWKKLPGRE